MKPSQWVRSLGRVTLLAGLLFETGFLLHAVVGWGPEGHRAVAHVASHYFLPTTLTRVQGLLRQGNFSSLEDAATWPDRIKAQRPDTRPWHYAGGQGSWNHSEPCAFHFPADCGDPDHPACILTALEEMLTHLRPVTRPLRWFPRRSFGWRLVSPAEALAYVVHFLGDLVQPLHVSAAAQGGNALDVVFQGHSTNLHAVWDTQLIQHVMATHHAGQFDAWVTALLHVPLRPTHVAGAQCGALLDPTHVGSRRACLEAWAHETNALVCRAVYATLPARTVDLADDYAPHAHAVVQRQLVRGGLRLAALLNNLLGDVHDDPADLFPRLQKQWLHDPS